MTVTQVLDAARNQLNALSDTNWSDTELLQSLYRVMLYVARKTRCIENLYTTTSTASTAEYSKPTRTIEIVRVTYAGTKLQMLDWREYDSINPSNASSTGTPSYYMYFNDTLTLYPTPSASGDTIKIWSIDEPDVPTSTSTLEIPTPYHDVLVTGLASEMTPKDLGHPLTAFFRDRYLSGIADIEAHMQRRKRRDRFAIVKQEEGSLVSDFGII